MSNVSPESEESNTTDGSQKRIRPPLFQTLIILFVVMFLTNLFLKPIVASYLPAPSLQMNGLLKAVLDPDGLLSFLVAVFGALTALLVNNLITRLRSGGAK